MAVNTVLAETAPTGTLMVGVKIIDVPSVLPTILVNATAKLDDCLTLLNILYLATTEPGSYSVVSSITSLSP